LTNQKFYVIIVLKKLERFIDKMVRKGGETKWELQLAQGGLTTPGYTKGRSEPVGGVTDVQKSINLSYRRAITAPIV